MGTGRTKITEIFLRKAEPGDHACSALPGFGARVHLARNGARSVRLFVRKGSRRVQLGAWPGGVSLSDARATAQDLLNQKEPVRPSSTLRSLGAVVEKYITEHINVRSKKSTQKEWNRLVRLHLAENELAKCKVNASDLSDRINSFFLSIGEFSQVSANHLLGIIRAAFKFCDLPNPCPKIKKFVRAPMNRFLNDDEKDAITDALEIYDEGLSSGLGNKLKRVDGTDAQYTYKHNPMATQAIRFLMITGMRKGEAINLRWKDADLRERIISMPDSKTGAKDIILSDRACAFLDAHRKKFPGRMQDLVFRGANDGPIYQLGRTWEKIRELAGLDGRDGKDPVRLHDLRHTLVSDLIRAGFSLEIAGDAVGHKSVQTTKRYAHLARAFLREALNKSNH